MHARVSTYGVGGRPGHVELGPFEEALDAIAALDGFEHGYVLVDDEVGTVRTVTVWRDHDALVASRVRATTLRTAAARACSAEVASTVELRIASRRAAG